MNLVMETEANKMSEDPIELSDGDRSSLNAEMSTDTISQ